MTISEVIKSFIAQNELAIHFLKNEGRDYEHVDKHIPYFVSTLEKTNFSPPLGLNFTRFLQLSDKKEHYQQYTLDNVHSLFNSLLQLEQSTLDTYIEAAHFEWGIMNNRNDAIEIIRQGIEKAQRRIDGLQELLFEIAEEVAQQS